MIEPKVRAMIACFALLKGAAIVAVTEALDITFWRALIIAFVSGLIGACGAVLAAIISARAAHENRELIRDVKRKVGADQRSSDDGTP